MLGFQSLLLYAKPLAPGGKPVLFEACPFWLHNATACGGQDEWCLCVAKQGFGGHLHSLLLL